MLSSPLELRGILTDLILTFASVVQTLNKPKVLCFKSRFNVHLWSFTFNQYLEQPKSSLRPVNLNNTCPLRITAAAGTKLAGTFFSSWCHYLRYAKWVYNLIEFSFPLCPIAGSSFRPLSNIPHCCPLESEPFFSLHVADRPSRPAKRYRLGGLLYVQLPWYLISLTCCDTIFFNVLRSSPKKVRLLRDS